MKVRNIALILLLSSVFFISCNVQDKCFMEINLKTSKDEGINYYRVPLNIAHPKGQLIFENTSSIPVKLSIYNRTLGYLVQCVHVLKEKEVFSYNNLDKNAKYVLGITVDSDVGSKDITLLAYNNKCYRQSGGNVPIKERNVVREFFEELGLVLVL